MQIRLWEVRRTGGENVPFSFEYVPDGSLCDIPGVSVSGPVTVTGAVTTMDRKRCLIRAKIAYTLSGECTNCGKPFSRTYETEFEEEFTADGEDGYRIVSDTVDLKKATCDQLILSLPYRFVCGEDCEGFGKTEY